MAKRIIRLTESDLRNIIKESVRKILKEEKPDPNAKPWELFKKSKFYKGNAETKADVEKKAKKFGDWRDTYDEYMNNNSDRDRGTEIGKKYRGELKTAFNGDKDAMAKALNRHINYREMLRRERLQGTEAGRKLLDNDSLYDTDEFDDTVENNAAMTADDFEKRLKRAMESGMIK